jgi:hypothetical protein
LAWPAALAAGSTLPPLRESPTIGPVAGQTSSDRPAPPTRRTPAIYLRGVEAASYLTAASLAIRLLPFRRLLPILTRALRCPELAGTDRTRAIADVRRAVRAAAARLPNRPLCFPQAVAAQAMLRRRGVASTVCYGVNTGGGQGLSAHVWLVAGDDGVVGQGVAAQFPLLATYSNASPPGAPDLVAER